MLSVLVWFFSMKTIVSKIFQMNRLNKFKVTILTIPNSLTSGLANFIYLTIIWAPNEQPIKSKLMIQTANTLFFYTLFSQWSQNISDGSGALTILIIYPWKCSVTFYKYLPLNDLIISFKTVFLLVPYTSRNRSCCPVSSNSTSATPALNQCLNYS